MHNQTLANMRTTAQFVVLGLKPHCSHPRHLQNLVGLDLSRQAHEAQAELHQSKAEILSLV